MVSRCKASGGPAPLRTTWPYIRTTWPYMRTTSPRKGGKMKSSTISMIEGCAWTVLCLVWGGLLLVRLSQGEDYHHAAISGLLTCILAKMSFRAAREDR